MSILFAVLSGYAAAMLAPGLNRLLGTVAAGRVLSLAPLGLTAYFATLTPRVLAGQHITTSLSWVPGLGVALSFRVDGLSLLFALIVAGIGSLVLFYASNYMKGRQDAGRFYLYILIFMASMLGLVLADNVVALFVFWELTSVSSYLLIGLNHDQERSRYAALQALLVTGIGGLALLAGLVLLGMVGGNLELSDLITRGETIRGHALYAPVLVLVLAGAFTKSAQFPFHFWLPNAMEAPTPVSAYLHSATMVKAGVYLLARLSPALGGTDAWVYTLTAFGAVTMVAGAFMALHKTDMKRILAYSTVSTLGMMVMLLGLGTGPAVRAMVVILIAHALYKGALFLMAGAVEHETGTRDTAVIGGLKKAMPVTAVAGVVAGLSMAGVPPLLGFIAKEAFYDATLHSFSGAVLTAVTVASSAALAAVVLKVAALPFFGRETHMPKHPHEAPPELWFGPVVLGALGLVFGLVPGLLNGNVSAVASLIQGEPARVRLALWHGLSPELILTPVTFAAGIALFAARGRMQSLWARLAWVARAAPERVYITCVAGMLRLAAFQTRILQNGSLRRYLTITLMTLVVLAGYTLVRFDGELHVIPSRSDSIIEYVIAAAMLTAALAAVWFRSLLSAIAAMGIVGYGIALVYVIFEAPDLAMTQLLVETLTVVLFVLGFLHLPAAARRLKRRVNIGNVIVSLSAGALVTLLVMFANGAHSPSALTPFFAENSYVAAGSKNLVNAILVDFRALDTLGEITVLGVAGIGVFALLKLRPGEKKVKK